ncbi:MAG: signal peptidase I [Spirochaetes bacterium]|nr:signal peptidase I [Spirochaetota bacterium]
MIQFLRFDGSTIEESRFSVISGRDSILFFLKRAVYLVLFVYSTLFLAAAIPFVKTPFIPIYFIGGCATAMFVLRLGNYIYRFVQYRTGGIAVTREGIELTEKDAVIKIPAADITYIEHNFLGNALIRQKYAKTSFPLMLLAEEDREKFLALFHDMAPRRTVLFRKIWDFVDAIVVALVLAVHIIQYIIQAYYIPTGSMEDTLKVGDHLFVEKITYGPVIPQMIGMKKPVHLTCMGIRKIKRGDIVIFRPPHDEDKDYIKRCIAVPGDRFEIKEGAVFINEKKTDEPYVKGITKPFNFGPTRQNEIEGVVPAGRIIVMGDNRENSQDSRFFGYLDIERIKGKAFILYWNTRQVFKLDFSRFGLIR